MVDQAVLKRARPRARSNLGTSVRIVGLLLLGCSAASATALLYPGRSGTSANTARAISWPEGSQGQGAPLPMKPAVKSAAPETPSAKPLPGAAPSAASGVSGVRQIPLSGGVDPTPATPPAITQARVQPANSDAAASTQPQAPPEQPASSPLASMAKAPTECLPAPLLSILEDVQ
jgi:hypothetical protein